MSPENNFTIKDNNSQIVSILPKDWVEPLIIISRVLNFDGIDSYVLSLIKDRLEMYLDTRDELGEDFQKYMKKIEGLEGLTDTETTSTETDNKGASEFVKDVDENYHDMKNTDDKEKESLK